MLFFICKDGSICALLALISIHPMLFFILALSKNSTKKSEFQYIQCYFLSWNKRSARIYLIRFQYIQCYFLSITVESPASSNIISIHPMLFFIGSGSGAATMYYNFNTSNVIFYPIAIQTCTDYTSISIHPMLFFIVLQSVYRIN